MGKGQNHRLERGRVRKKLLTLEKPKTTFMVSGARGERKHAVCWEQSLGTAEERIEGDQR